MDADGDFVVAWQDEHSGPTPGFNSVVARRFASGGAPVTGEFVVNATEVGHHRLPAAAMDADGDFVIAWAGFGQDPGDTQFQSGVYAQRYAEPRPQNGPRVTQVFVRGQTWAAAFQSYLRPTASARAPTASLSAAAPGSSPICPGRTSIQISIRFDGDVTAGMANLAVRGVNVAAYPVSWMLNDVSNRTATRTLAQPIAADKIRLDLTGVTGGEVSLDGEWATGGTFPSGNGAPGGDFSFRFDVLPGNVNRTGSVLADDFSAVKARFFRSTSNPGSGPNAYSVFHDVDGNGSIFANDFSDVKVRFFSSLPDGDIGSLFVSLRRLAQLRTRLR